MSRFAIFTEKYGGEIAVNVDRIFTAFQDDETLPVHLLMSEASSKDGVIEYEVQGTLRDVVNKLNGDEIQEVNSDGHEEDAAGSVRE